MSCPHQGERFVRRWIPIERGILPKSITAETDICADCGVWFGLGPSNDDVPEVQTEILAAKWAIEYDRPSRAGECPFGDECDLCQARYLAAAIREVTS
jgi:hypothetical protein